MNPNCHTCLYSHQLMGRISSDFFKPNWIFSGSSTGKSSKSESIIRRRKLWHTDGPQQWVLWANLFVCTTARRVKHDFQGEPKPFENFISEAERGGVTGRRGKRQTTTRPTSHPSIYLGLFLNVSLFHLNCRKTREYTERDDHCVLKWAQWVVCVLPWLHIKHT